MCYNNSVCKKCYNHKGIKKLDDNKLEAKLLKIKALAEWEKVARKRPPSKCIISF